MTEDAPNGSYQIAEQSVCLKRNEPVLMVSVNKNGQGDVPD
jgi:hypothetical protein